MEEKTTIYTFKTKDGQTRKAIDLYALNSFIDSRLIQSNPIMNEELNKTTIEEYRGKIAFGILMELNIQVKRDLGLIPEKDEEAEIPGNEPEEPEEKITEAPKQAHKQIQKQQAQQKEIKEEVEDMLTNTQNEDDDVVVLE